MKPQLTTLCGYAGRRSPMAVVNCVRITETHGYATNTSSSMRLDIDGPDGLDVCVDAGLLSGALSGFPDDQAIKIVKGDGAFIHLQAGRRKLKLRTVPVDGMPEIELSGESVELDALDLEPALKFCAEACIKKFTVKPELGNVLVDFAPDGVWVIGTDGLRAHVWKLDVERRSAIEMRCLVPRALADRVTAISKFGGKITLSRDRLVHRREGAEFRGMLNSAVYPNWRVFMVADDWFTGELRVGREVLSLAVDGARQLGAQWVELNAKDGELRVAAEASGDTYEHVLDIDFSGEMSYSLNPQFMVDALRHVDDEMPRLRFGKPGRPLVIDDGDAQAIIQGRRA